MNKDLQVNNPVNDIDGEEADREDDPGNKIVSDSLDVHNPELSVP